MDVAVCIGTFGIFSEWRDLVERAECSAKKAEPRQVLHVHGASLADARNKAAEQAEAEWICFLDADDELAPGYFEPMEKAEADLRCPAVVYVRRGRHEPPKLWPPCNLQDGNYLVIGTLIRKRLFFEVGGFREEEIYEDWALWARCWKAGVSIQQVPESHYIAHMNPGSRNRGPSRAERLRWHHKIRNDIWPELYA